MAVAWWEALWEGTDAHLEPTAVAPPGRPGRAGRSLRGTGAVAVDRQAQMGGQEAAGGLQGRAAAKGFIIQAE